MNGKSAGVTPALVTLTLPQEIALYPPVSARDNLRFFGRLYGMRGAALDERINAVLEAVGLADRGEIAVGKRADLIRVHVAREVPVVRSVWRDGRRVA